MRAIKTKKDNYLKRNASTAEIKFKSHENERKNKNERFI